MALTLFHACARWQQVPLGRMRVRRLPILLERIVPDEWLERLRTATSSLVERSRAVTTSDAVFDLEPDHTPDAPRLRRVSSPVDQSPVYWD